MSKRSSEMKVERFARPSYGRIGSNRKVLGQGAKGTVQRSHPAGRFLRIAASADLRQGSRALAFTAGFASVAILVGILAAEQPVLAAGLTLSVVAGVSVLYNWLTPVLLTFPATALVFRLSLGGTDMSLADVALVISLLVVFPLASRPSPPLRRLLTMLLLYAGALGVSVMANPTPEAGLEWMHRLVMVGGSLLVGSTIAVRERTHVALRLYLGAMALVAFASIAFVIDHGIQPAFPFGIHKNAAGPLLAIGLVVLAFPNVSRLGWGVAPALRILLVVGLLATQSKSAMVGLAVVAIGGLLARRARFRSPIMLVALVAMAAVVAVSASQQLADPNDAYNGINSRVLVNAQAWNEFQSSPLFGAGVRYFKAGAQTQPESHNVVYVTLAESGIAGLAGLVLLLSTVATQLRRRSSDLALLALLALILYVVHSMAGIFWVAGPGTIPWLLIGLAVGTKVQVRPPGVPSTPFTNEPADAGALVGPMRHASERDDNHPASTSADFGNR